MNYSINEIITRNKKFDSIINIINFNQNYLLKSKTYEELAHNLIQESIILYQEISNLMIVNSKRVNKLILKKDLSKERLIKTLNFNENDNITSIKKNQTKSEEYSFSNNKLFDKEKEDKEEMLIDDDIKKLIIVSKEIEEELKRKNNLTIKIDQSTPSHSNLINFDKIEKYINDNDIRSAIKYWKDIKYVKIDKFTNQKNIDLLGYICLLKDKDLSILENKYNVVKSSINNNDLLSLMGEIQNLKSKGEEVITMKNDYSNAITAISQQQQECDIIKKENYYLKYKLKHHEIFNLNSLYINN